jgi:hypothetical protein
MAMSHRRKDGDRRSVEDDRIDDVRLGRGEEAVIAFAKQAVGQTIERFAPDGANRLAMAAVAVCGMFADLTRSFATAPALIEAMNKHLEHSGYRLIQVARS